MSSDKELQRAKWLNGFSSGQKWLEKIGSANTQKIFTDYFKRYCDYTKQTPDQLIALKVQGLQNVGTEREFVAEDLLETYFRENKGMRPTARLMMRSTVFSFYKHNKRSLEPSTASNIKNETPESKKRKPSLEDLTALEVVMRTARDKAMLWFTASTSVRVGTLVLLKWCDLKQTENSNVPYYLEIESARLKGCGKGRYKGNKQICFVHKFASEKLEQYRAEAKQKGYELKDDSPLFVAYYQKGKEKPQKPLTTKGINELFNHVSLAAFGDLEKKRFSIHDLREFYQSALESAGIQENLISPLMAHKIAGIAQNYSSHDCKELIGKYETALPYLIPKSNSVLESELKETETKFKTQNKEIKAMREVLLTFVDRDSLELMVRQKMNAIPDFSMNPEIYNRIVKKNEQLKDMSKTELMEYYNTLNEWVSKPKEEHQQEEREKAPQKSTKEALEEMRMLDDPKEKAKKAHEESVRIKEKIKEAKEQQIKQ